jgi:hypothetical protein
MSLFHHRKSSADLLEATAKDIRADLQVAVMELTRAAADQRAAANELQMVAKAITNDYPVD